MDETKRKDYKNFIIRETIYCIIYAIAIFVLQFKINTIFCGAVITFIYVIIIEADAIISAKKNNKKDEKIAKLI